METYYKCRRCGTSFKVFWKWAGPEREILFFPDTGRCFVVGSLSDVNNDGSTGQDLARKSPRTGEEQAT